MTYGEWYLAGMYEFLERGGKEEEIDRLVMEVNHPTQEGLDKFLKLRGLPAPFLGMVSCGACGEPYAHADDAPTLDKEMLCPSCKKATHPA